MIDNTHYQTIDVAEHANFKHAQLKRSKQLIQWQTPHAEKLSRADLHIHSTYSDGIPNQNAQEKGSVGAFCLALAATA